MASTIGICILRLRGLMACPFFMPEQRSESDWPFPQRLPLGAGWTGTCMAPGHTGARPNEDELKSACNIGYAKRCNRLPGDRHADAVRFALGEERDGMVRVLFVCERAYLPASHGELFYDKARGAWPAKHADPCLQRMAECYLQARLQRRSGPVSAE